MIFERYYLSCLSHASYLIADEASKQAVVVDPQRDVDRYLAEAEAKGLTIKAVFLTHFHADFLAGHLELRERTGAEIRLGSRAEAEYPFVAMSDGEVLDLGPTVRLCVLQTPGHTPEGISLVVTDLARGEAPYAVLTGDTLFVGDVGRPDLMASFGVSEEDLAGMLYDSLHEKLLALPDETLVYPAHGAGSLCGKALGSEDSSTIGKERRTNLNLQPMSREDFIERVRRGQIDAPAYFAHDAVLNRQEYPTRIEGPAPLSLELALREVNAGAALLDVRSVGEFAKEHIDGSINLGLGGRFASWAGTMVEVGRPIVLVAEPGSEEEAAMRLGRIGYDVVKGYVEGGVAVLAERPDLRRSVDRIPVEELAQRREASPDLVVLDVRNPQEYEAGHIPGSRNIPLSRLPDNLTDLPQGNPIYVHCKGDYRSACALGFLEQAGLEVIQVVGGYDAWQALTAASTS